MNIINEKRLKEEKKISVKVDSKGIISVDWIYENDNGEDKYCINIYINKNIYHKGELYDSLKDVFRKDFKPIVHDFRDDLINMKLYSDIQY